MAGPECFVLDTGELGAVLRATDVAFVAGSLDPMAAQRAGTGGAGHSDHCRPEHVQLHRVAELLIDHGACVRIRYPRTAAVTAPSSKPDLPADGPSQIAVVENERSAVQRTLDIVHRTLAGKAPVTA